MVPAHQDLRALGPSDAAEAEARFQQHVKRFNVRGARTAAGLIAVLVPAFSALDWFVLGGHFGSLLALRLGIAATAVVIIVASFNSKAPDWSKFFTVYLPLSAALSIVAMVHIHEMDQGGMPSQYYAGLILVVVGAGQLFLWPAVTGILVFGAVFAAYLLPTLLLKPTADGVLFLSNNVFLGSTMIVAVVGQHFTYNLNRREVYASFTVEASARKLEDANLKLKELDKYKTQFFANVTHELKTPLTLILAPTEAILRGEIGQFTESQQEYIRRIYQNGLRLMKLISDLLDLARLEDSKMRLRIEELDAAHFLERLAHDIRPLAERKGIRLTTEVNGEPPIIFADRHRLEQIFVNLLSNAVKFTGEGGAIRLIAWGDADAVRVCVSDTGIGIPPDKLEVIFDRFSQVDGSSTRRYGGTGIGLALARELVELHGGHIWAESVLGSGTTVHTQFMRGRDHFPADVLERRSLTHDVARNRRLDGALPEWWEQLTSRNEYRLLPVEEVSERRLAPRDKDIRRERGIVRRVLIVEDSREMLQFLHMQLREHFDLYLAENGARGWDLLQRMKPDLVVTDYMMPEMDGRELTRLIRASTEFRHVPVVMLTAKTDVEDRMEGRKAGADQYLAKPFSSAELIQVIQGLLNVHEEQADQLFSQRMDSLQLVSARMAHEIHNPLNYIRNGALIAQRTMEKLLASLDGSTGTDVPQSLPAQREKLAERMRSMIEQITKGADHIAKSVELLRAYSREGYRAEETAHEVQAALQGVLSIVSPKDGSSRRMEFVAGESVKAKCVPQEFHEVFTNLVQNAMDASKEGSLIRVAVSQTDSGMVRITVSDQGEGIPPENLDRIFVPMFTTKAPGQGMGMGLAITHRLVKKAGGRILVQSAVGAGTTFEVLWPKA